MAPRHVLAFFKVWQNMVRKQHTSTDSLYLTAIKTCLISNPLCPLRPAHRRRKGCYTAGCGFVHHGCSSLTLRNGSCFSWVSISSRRVSSALACTLVPWARYKNALPIQGKVGDPSVALGSIMKALHWIPHTQRHFNRFLFLKQADRKSLGQFSFSTCTISGPFRSEKEDNI